MISASTLARRVAWPLLAALALAAPASALQAVAPTEAAPAEAARAAQREQILEDARRYAEFEWRGDARNVLHGPDPQGTTVDTPDASFDAKGWRTDGVNRGMPYSWGGFTSIEDFEAGLAQGLPAGHVPADEHVQKSGYTLGLDCSGYIARCWDLPVKQSTRSLGALCYPLDDVALLEPGDILNLFDGHVVLFERWLDAERTRMRVYEAGRLAVVASEYTAEQLERGGFKPMRYKPLDARWLPMDFARAAFRAPEIDAAPGAVADAATLDGRWTALPGEVAITLDGVASPLADARPLEWVRYAVDSDGLPEGADAERASMVAVAEGTRVEIQTDTRLFGKHMATGSTCARADQVLEALPDFIGSEEPLSAVTVTRCTVTPGDYRVGGRDFAATRLQLELEAQRVMRHREYPVSLAIDCVLSDEVPVHGVLESAVRSETVWRAEPPEERVVSREITRLLLCEFGGPEG